MILLLSLSLLNRRQMKQTRFKRMVSFKPSPQQLQLCSRNDHYHQTPSTSLSLSARYFNFLLKPNHCFHHCISSYPANPPPPNFSISSLKGRWRSQRSSQFTQPKTFQPIGFMYIKHSPGQLSLFSFSFNFQPFFWVDIFKLFIYDRLIIYPYALVVFPFFTCGDSW
ncbi:hypothetical protein AAZX31_04G212200 [Glycine max]